MTTNRCAPYFCTDEPDDAELERQLHSMWNFAREQGWSVVEYYPEIGSGLDINRKCLGSMLRDARRGLLDIVLVVNLMILSQNLTELSGLVGQLEDAGVRLRFAENARAVGFIV